MRLMAEGRSFCDLAAFCHSNLSRTGHFADLKSKLKGISSPMGPPGTSALHLPYYCWWWSNHIVLTRQALAQ
jgi:hypothetical protein